MPPDGSRTPSARSLQMLAGLGAILAVVGAVIDIAGSSKGAGTILLVVGILLTFGSIFAFQRRRH
ncbi:MAG: hypothetical protein M3Y91_19425 [Actinomycetota bacterium]|nr:hypothetical protein [Actinomycetota bacterium]